MGMGMRIHMRMLCVHSTRGALAWSLLPPYLEPMRLESELVAPAQPKVDRAARREPHQHRGAGLAAAQRGVRFEAQLLQRLGGGEGRWGAEAGVGQHGSVREVRRGTGVARAREVV